MVRVTSDSILTPEETMPNFQGLVILSQIYFVLCGINCLAIMVFPCLRTSIMTIPESRIRIRTGTKRCAMHGIAQVMILSFLRINADLSQLTDTFIFMMGDLLQFGIILMLLVLGFVLMSHVLFGTSLAEVAFHQCFLPAPCTAHATRAPLAHARWMTGIMHPPSSQKFDSKKRGR